MKSERQETLIEELLSQLTLEEKIGMIHGAGLFCTAGVERLSIPPLYMSDGPMGVRAEFADNEWRSIGTTEDYVTYLPCNSAIASTWNRELAEKAGEVLGEEARGRGKDVILAPGINIKRSPLCGRNFEYMSEDPRLVEELVVPLIKGIQKSDVAACVKHFAANSQETERLWVDTKVDERTLREIYYPGFRAAVEKGGIFSLMGAYNLLNGEHCCTSKSLLNRVLREEWNFDGTVISDWGGVHDTEKAAESALDIEMDVTYEFDKHHMASPLLEKIRAGEISEELIDEKIQNILRMMLRLHMIGEQRDVRKSGAYNTPEHRQAVLEVARESVILLKNEEHLLPLDERKVKKVAVIGQNGAAIHSNGGGSAEIKALYEISPLMGIKKLLGGNTKVCYAPGYYIPGKENQGSVSWQADSTKHLKEPAEEADAQKNAETAEVSSAGKLTCDSGKAKEKKAEEQKRIAYREEAVALARECDTVIFIGGLNHDFDVEGKDRADMKLPYGQDEVLAALLKTNPNTIVVLYAGSPVEMPWRNDAKAILFSYYAGMEGGTAIAEVLFGKVNPSGKLAETLIQNVNQCPAHSIGTFGRTDQVEYREGVMVGYRYYDTEWTEVSFCFGHGLSYSSFAYERMTVTEVLAAEDAESVMPEGAKYCVTVLVKNTGTVTGKETVQLYVAPKHTKIIRPYHELRAFEKVELAPGETKKLVFWLSEQDFTYYEEESRQFVVEDVPYEIQLGASARDIRLQKEVEGVAH